MSSVVVEAAPLDAAQTVAAGVVAKTVSPSAGKLGIKSVTINPTPSSAKTVTPTKTVQNVAPEDGQLLSGVTVNAIPAEYIVPTGAKPITANGTVDVKAFETATVNVPNKVSEITITANGEYVAKEGEIGYSKIIVNVATP